METYTKQQQLQKQIKVLVLFFMIGIILSGITAFPIETEIEFFDNYFIISSCDW